jgi:hypothetical protein
MVYNFISPCISVLSVPSVVKRYFDCFLFNRRDHGGHGDTRRTFVLLYYIYFDYSVLIDHVIFYTILKENEYQGQVKKIC